MNCQALRNIPKKKLDIIFNKINSTIDSEEKRQVLKKAYSRYYEANVPCLYWNLNMKDFKGDNSLKDFYDKFAEDVLGSYEKGRIVCFAGSYGLGKTTLVTNIIKKVVESGYSGLYTTMNDLIAVNQTSDSFAARKELFSTDYVVLDELDGRTMGNSSNATSYFGRTLEDVFRSRMQNNLPLYLCTNSPNPLETFEGPIKESLTSLWNHVEMVYVLGDDFRKELRVD